MIPAQKGETSLRIRLSFLADQWRIDHVGVASAAAGPGCPGDSHFRSELGTGGRPEDTARESLRAPDNRYLQTNPATASLPFQRRPSGGRDVADVSTFFPRLLHRMDTRVLDPDLAAAEPFKPTDQAILAALQKWAATREVL